MYFKINRYDVTKWLNRMEFLNKKFVHPKQTQLSEWPMLILQKLPKRGFKKKYFLKLPLLLLLKKKSCFSPKKRYTHLKIFKNVILA